MDKTLWRVKQCMGKHLRNTPTNNIISQLVVKKAKRAGPANTLEAVTVRIQCKQLALPVFVASFSSMEI